MLNTLGINPFMVPIMLESYLRKMNDGKRILYTALAESVPRGEVENAGHTTINTARSDAVVRAIRGMVDSLRDVTTTPRG